MTRAPESRKSMPTPISCRQSIWRSYGNSCRSTTTKRRSICCCGCWRLRGPQRPTRWLPGFRSRPARHRGNGALVAAPRPAGGAIGHGSHKTGLGSCLRPASICKCSFRRHLRQLVRPADAPALGARRGPGVVHGLQQCCRRSTESTARHPHRRYVWCHWPLTCRNRVAKRNGLSRSSAPKLSSSRGTGWARTSTRLRSFPSGARSLILAR